LEPPGAGQVQDLSLERDRCEDAVEGALPVGRHQDETVAEVVPIPDLPAVLGGPPDVGVDQAIAEVAPDPFRIVWRRLDRGALHGLSRRSADPSTPGGEVKRGLPGGRGDAGLWGCGPVWGVG